MTDSKVGDRVKVTTEGTVGEFNDGGKVRIHTGDDGGFGFGPEDTFAWVGTDVQVEKTEPPVEVFKPGDVVRSGVDGRIVIAITRDGYTYVGPVNRGLTVTRKDRIAPGFEEFTSRDFERVNLDSLA